MRQKIQNTVSFSKCGSQSFRWSGWCPCFFPRMITGSHADKNHRLPQFLDRCIGFLLGLRSFASVHLNDPNLKEYILDRCAKSRPGSSLRTAGTGEEAVFRVQTKHGEMASSHHAANCWSQLCSS